MKIQTERLVRYYVMDGDWVYGGPFDTKDEAKECLEAYKATRKQTPRNNKSEEVRP